MVNEANAPVYMTVISCPHCANRATEAVQAVIQEALEVLLIKHEACRWINAD